MQPFPAPTQGQQKKQLPMTTHVPLNRRSKPVQSAGVRRFNAHATGAWTGYAVRNLSTGRQQTPLDMWKNALQFLYTPLSVPKYTHGMAWHGGMVRNGGIRQDEVQRTEQPLSVLLHVSLACNMPMPGPMACTAVRLRSDHPVVAIAAARLAAHSRVVVGPLPTLGTSRTSKRRLVRAPWSRACSPSKVTV
ncbi:hypothetical protein BKA81DRAFT_380960 [Phyllosticta paracitricarpa]